jgi:hypothetical protein
MSRELRVQFPNAIYHVTSRGNRRQDIVLDDVDRDTFFQRIGKTVAKYGWRMFAAALMTNHFHLNPVPVLVDRPEQWSWSSYAGYVDASCRLPWIDYTALLNAWQGACGGWDAAEAYRQYVESELKTPRRSPFQEAIEG